jgi:hypothetical protein
VDAGLHGVADAVDAFGMNRDAPPLGRSLFDGGADFLNRELRLVPAVGDGSDAAGRTDLDEVGATLLEFAHDAADFLDAVGHGIG